MMCERLHNTGVSARCEIFLTIIFISLFSYNLHATHVVGGVINYVYNGDSSYTITLKVYRDCGGFNGPSSVTIAVRGYNGFAFNPTRDISINSYTSSFVPSNLDTCADPPNPMPCVEERVFTTTVNNLPPNPGGYHLYYQTIARNWSLTNLNAINNTVGETFYAYIPGYTVGWYENFLMANGTTSDAGTTAWTRTLGATVPNYAQVNGNVFEFSGNDNASATWASQVINISSYTSGVNLSVDLSENSGLEANDSIILYYSVDGGPQTVFSTNGIIADDFTGCVATQNGLVGNTIQVFAYVHYDGASSGEIYRIDNVYVSQNNFQANSNAEYTIFPPLFLCVGQPFIFDHSASDIDGDSLVYSFYTPYDGHDGSSPANPVPPSYSNNTISFTPVNFLAGYTAANPLGGTPLNLNSSTGLLTGTPSTLGQYVVGIMVKEYRNGICIDSTMRDFQFNVVNCPPPATAVLPDTTSACSGLIVNFSNQGNPSSNNWWSFGDPAVTDDTAVTASPSYSYPQPGYYDVVLITNKGTFCADSDTTTVLVCWVDAGFVSDTVGCAGDILDFNDTSTTSSNAIINYWEWIFGDGDTVYAEDTSHIYVSDGTYTVTHIVTNDLGCSDTVTKNVVIDPAPVFEIDMTGNPDSVWSSPSVVRDCKVCGATGVSMVCITFILTLDPGTQAISFDLTAGAVPPGALYYQVNCGDSFPVGDTICISGVGPHHITFCKPGNNPNVYTISAITAPEVSPPVTVSDGCMDTISAAGYIETSVTWTSVSPGAQGAYNAYMSCSAGCDTVIVTSQPGYPPSVNYMVCGLPQGGGSCSMTPVCDTTTVYFVSTLATTIVPQNPTVCFGGTNATITATPGGGAAPYTYQWSTGATTASITVGVGTYYVTVSDTTNCQPVTDSVTVTAFASAITANAGNDQVICASSPTVNLTGIVTGVSTGIWSGGNGIFSPGADSLITSYNPTAAEINTAAVQLVLNTTNNGNCPPDADTIQISFDSVPTTSNAGADQVICGVTTTTLSANAPTIGTGVWSIVSGSATITSPNANSTTITGLTAGNSYIFRWTISNGVCPPSTDDVTVSVDLLPTTANAGPDQVICNSTSVNLSGNTALIGTGMWSLVSGTGIINSPNSPTSTISGLVAGTSCTLQWTITQGGCTSSDNVTIAINQNPSTPSAGPDQTLCNVTTASLGGNTASIGTGQWTVVTGIATINTPTSPTSVVSGLVPGTSVALRWTISNGVCPPSSDDVIITINELPTDANAGPDQIICSPNATLAANVPTVGTGAWTVISGTASISNPTTNNSTVTGLAAGSSYTFRWTISNGVCPPSTDDVTINVDISPTVASAGPDLVLCGVTSGNLAGNNPVVGTGNWTLFSGTATINAPGSPATSIANLVAGTINVFVWTISNGICPPSSDSVTVNIDLTPTTASAGSDQVLCNVTSTSFSANTPTVGSGLWSIISGTGVIANDASPTSGISGLIQGDTVYAVWTIAQGQCKSTDTLYIYNDDFDSINISIAHVNCFEGGDGSAIVTPVNGNSSYTYLWSNSQMDSIATGLSAGSFSVTVTDANGCNLIGGVQISEPTILIVSIDSSSNVSCFNGNDGMATATASGGTPGYILQWSNGNTGSFIQNLSAGEYSLTVTDSNNCTGTDTIMIIEPPSALSGTISLSSVLCKGDSTGTATILPSGGIPPYTYQWDASASNQNDSTATGLAAGVYMVTITDDNNCTYDTAVTVIEPSTLLSLDTSSSFVICNGDNDGTATVTPSGGISPYAYQWDINTNGQADSTATGLIAGNYSVTVTDNNGCAKITQVFVDQPYSPLSISLVTDSVNCYGGNDGMASVTPAGGTSPYTYTWDDANAQTDSIADGLSAGVYNVTVTDNTGNCKVGNSIAVNQPDSLILFPFSGNVSCFGGNDGFASITVSGGTSPYAYLWNNGSVSIPVTGLSAGIYAVTVTDVHNCQDSISFNITQPALPLSITSLVSENVKCNGGSDGSANVSLSGGTTPYSYSWNDPGQSLTAGVSGLYAGTYSVSVTDTNNCTLDTSIIITEPTPGLTVAITATDVNCNGGNDGTATITPAGGTSPYFYQWDANANSQTDSTATGLPTGTYSVTVTDNNGCLLDTNSAVFVGQPSDSITVTISLYSVSCNGDSDGAGILTATGGTLPYSYLWDANANSQTDSTATGLIAGIYYAIVTDNNGCTVDSIELIITEPSPLVTTFSSTDVICKGENNGTATITPSGGTSPYFYQWDAAANNQTDSSATGLIAGTYTITATDNNGCVNTLSVSVTEPADSLTLAITYTDVICYGDSSGSGSITATGGISPYTYQWDAGTGFQTDSSATGLKPGTYSVIVSDKNGCVDSSASVTISQPLELLSSVSQNDTVCPGQLAIISVTASGGISPYTYNWNIGPGQNQTVSPVNNTIYTVTITDANNCTSSADTVIVYVRNYYFDSLKFSCGSAANCVLCPGGSTQISATYFEEFPPYSYQWFGLGTGLGPFTVSPDTTTNYILIVSDDCGSFPDTLTVYVDSFPKIDMPAVYDDNCVPLAVTFENNVQNPPGSQYFWNFGDSNTSQESTPTHIYSNDGTYIVSLIITTPANCSDTADTATTVIVRPLPEPDCSASPQTATLQNPVINFQTGNFTSYVWDFDDGDTSSSQNPVHTYKDSGDYLVDLTVTNQYNCENTCEVQIRINPLYPLGIPNAFTPNPNGPNGGYYSFDDFTNNVFFPITRYVTDYHLEIFNRWGELLFESFDIKIGWDGYYRGEICQQDVYVWKIYIKWWDNQQFNEVGDVTLLR